MVDIVVVWLYVETHTNIACGKAWVRMRGVKLAKLLKRSCHFCRILNQISGIFLILFFGFNFTENWFFIMWYWERWTLGGGLLFWDLRDVRLRIPIVFTVASFIPISCFWFWLNYFLFLNGIVVRRAREIPFFSDLVHFWLGIWFL